MYLSVTPTRSPLAPKGESPGRTSGTLLALPSESRAQIGISVLLTCVAKTESVGTRIFLRYEREVASVSVPLSYTGELYHLRLHIGFLQEKLEKLADRSARHRASGLIRDFSGFA
jgi:hypothetical protein